MSANPSPVRLPLQQPKPATLKRYGLSLEAWEAIADRQGRVCGVCGGLPASGKLHIDHSHVKGWRKMKPAERAKHVRGLACFPCNSRFLSRGMTPAKGYAIGRYLEDFEFRACFGPEASNDNAGPILVTGQLDPSLDGIYSWIDETAPEVTDPDRLRDPEPGAIDWNVVKAQIDQGMADICNSPEFQSELAQWDVTLMDGLADDPWLPPVVPVTDGVTWPPDLWPTRVPYGTSSGTLEDFAILAPVCQKSEGLCQHPRCGCAGE